MAWIELLQTMNNDEIDDLAHVELAYHDVMIALNLCLHIFLLYFSLIFSIIFNFLVLILK